MRKRSRGNPRKCTLDIREILEAHKRGMSLGEIGEPYGVTRQAISDRLRRANATPLTCGWRKGRKRSAALVP